VSACACACACVCACVWYEYALVCMHLSKYLFVYLCVCVTFHPHVCQYRHVLYAFILMSASIDMFYTRCHTKPDPGTGLEMFQIHSLHPPRSLSPPILLLSAGRRID